MKILLNIIVIVFLNLNLYSYENIKWEIADIPELTFLEQQQLGFLIENTVMLDVMFLEDNPDYGWISGFNSVTLRTTDGGVNWEYSLVDRQNKYQLESIYFVNENVGYASGPYNVVGSTNWGAIFKSTDGGITWKNITPTIIVAYVNFYDFVVRESVTPSVWGCYFEDENVGYFLAGQCGVELRLDNGQIVEQKIFKTTDGGNTWNLFGSNTFNTKFADLIVDENNIGWAVSSGILWKSNPEKTYWEIDSYTGGRDWHEDISKFNNSFVIPYSKTCAGDSSIAGGIRISTDNGISWSDYSTNGPMYGSLMENDSTGWGVGHNASVYQTTSGGLEWKNINTCLEGGDFIDDIAKTNDGVYWLVGDKVWYSKPAIFDTITRQTQKLEACYKENVILDLDTTIQNIFWDDVSGESIYEFEATESKTITAEYYVGSCPDTVYYSIFEIDVLPLPDFQIAFSNSDPCVGDEVVVSVNPNFKEYTWSKLDNISDDMVEFVTLPFNSSSATITESGSYAVTIIDEFDCEHTYDFELFFKPLPTYSLDYIGRLNFCLGDTVKLIATHNGVDVEWYQKGTEEKFSEEDTLNILETGDYYAIITSENGCTITTESIYAESRIDTNNYRLSAEFDGNWFDDDIVEKDEFICNLLTIRNYRDFDAILENPIMLGNIEFSIPAYQLPITIPANSSQQLEVCFQAIGEALRQDTIKIIDRCSDHYLPLKTIVKDKVENANTKCNLELELVDVSLKDEYFITFGIPFPNPANDNTEFQFIEFIPFLDNVNVKIELFDIFGVKIDELTYNIVETQEQKYGELRKSVVNINLKDLSSGIYLLRIESPVSLEQFRIIKE